MLRGSGQAERTESDHSQEQGMKPWVKKASTHLQQLVVRH